MVAARGIGVACLAATLLAGCGGGAASASEVASVAGATACDNSGFYVQSKLTGHNEVIYDCRFAKKLPKCVTYSGKLAIDATSQVELLFATALNPSRPACLRWLKSAEAAKADAARNAWKLAVRRTGSEPWHRGFHLFGHPAEPRLPNIYWEWMQPPFSCSGYAPDGCLKVKVITRYGCPHGVTIQFDELRAGAQVGTVSGSSGPLQPKTIAVLEIDPDQRRIGGRIATMVCN
jgi:hypothetical protein